MADTDDKIPTAVDEAADKTNDKAAKEPTERKYDYAKDHKKPIEVIAREEAVEKRNFKAEAEKLKKELEEEPAKEEITPEAAKVEPKVEPKSEVDTAKVAAEAAQKAVDDYKAELQKVEDSKLSEVKKAEKAEELKAKWTGKTETGEVTPKDYDEIVAEARRIAREDFRAELDEREAVRTQTQLEEQAKQEQIQKQNQANQEYISRRIVEERDRMYDNKVLDRPADPNDTNDPIVVRERALFTKALEVNTERQKVGQEPITSIADIYYNYFLPDEKSKQPAGADAPISGSSITADKQSSSDKYDYARDHKKSLVQMARELMGK